MLELKEWIEDSKRSLVNLTSLNHLRSFEILGIHSGKCSIVDYIIVFQLHIVKVTPF